MVTIFLTASYYLQFESALRDRVFLQLSSVKQLKKVKILSELEDRLKDFQQFRQDSLSEANEGTLISTPLDSLLDSIAGYSLKKVDSINESPKVIDLTAQRPDAGIAICIVAREKGRMFYYLISLPDIQNILLERTGLGETGESYLVNAENQLITKSRFSVNGKNITVQTKGVIQAFQGNSGTDVFMDYRDIRVLGAFEKIEFNGLEWVLLSEINFKEAMKPLRDLRTDLFFIFALILIFILIVSYYLSRMVVKPIITMEQGLIDLSRGILDQDYHHIDREDEIGLMFSALTDLIKTLQKTVVFAGEIGEGNFQAEFNPVSDQDKLGEALLKMKYQLQEFKANEFKLMQENQLSIIEGQEKERSRLSKELHDGVGPLMTTLRMQIQSSKLSSKLKSELLTHFDGTIDEIRRISNNLMPSVLEDFGVGEAIGNLIDQLKTSDAISFRFKNDMNPDSTVNKTVQITLYRIAQEAINNAIRHSKCSEVRVSISEFDEYIGLFVSDNGIGFDTDQHFSGNGIRNMKERIKLVKGALSLVSDNAGTKIEIEIPLNEHN